MRRKISPALLLLSILVLPAAVRAADLHLPAIFSDNMVLQRNFATPVWGTADPNAAITVTVANQKKLATANADGKWMVELDPIKEGGPFELSISGPSTTPEASSSAVSELTGTSRSCA